ncbi:sensor histidine kinase [Enterococcus sp. LJL98]
MELAKKSAFLMICLNFLLFIFTTYLLDDFLQSFMVLLSSQSILLTLFVFLFSSFIFIRTTDFNWRTVSYLLTIMLLGWTIYFYTLFPDMFFPYVLSLTAHFLLPLSFLVFFYTFTPKLNKIWLISGLLSLVLVNFNNYQRKEAAWDLLLMLLWCFFFYFIANHRHSSHAKKTQKFILKILVLTFTLYIVLLSLPNFLLNIDYSSVTFLLLNGTSYLLLPMVPVISIGYLLIQKREIRFMLDFQDYLLQLGFGVLLFGTILFISIDFLKIPLPHILMITTMFYLIYFVSTVLTQQQFLTRYTNLTMSNSKQKQTFFDEQVFHAQLLSNLDQAVEQLLGIALDPKGFAIIWKTSHHSFIIQKHGSLENIRLSKKLMIELEMANDTLYYQKHPLIKKEWNHHSELQGWILIDSPSKPDFSVLNNLIPLLLFSEKLSGYQRSILPEYLSIYQEQLQDATYLHEMEKLRKELSYYLHDDILQTILAVKNVAEVATGNKEDLLLTLQKISIYLTQVNQRIREKTFDLYPSMLKDLPFKQSVLALVEQFKARQANDNFPLIHIQIDDAIEIPEIIRFTTYRILKELIQNALKHAQAKNIIVKIEEHQSLINLSVEDDGIGFSQNQSVQNHFGLRSVIQDVHSLSGKMKILSSDLKGSHIQIEIIKEEK